jgi:hypothetical protein
VSVDERCDVSPEGSDAAIDAAPDLLIGKEREEALDLVELSIARRITRIMKCSSTMASRIVFSLQL